MHQKKLYIADDNIEFAEFCGTVAEREGWVVSISSNGADLLKALAAETGPAFILCDIQMPDCDGIEVIQALPAASPRFRVRFVTGGSMTNALTARLIAQARDIDIGRFLTKPVTMEELQNTLRNEERLLCATANLDIR